MRLYTEDIKSHELLKRLIVLTLRLNGFDVEVARNPHSVLFQGQDKFDCKLNTVIIKSEKRYINWHFLAKCFQDREDGYGKITIDDRMLERLCTELEAWITVMKTEVPNGRPAEDEAQVKA